MNVELRHLETFVAVADTGGIGLAAQRLALSQSVVSVRIGQLERELSVALVERGRTGVTLTPAGRALAVGLPPAIAAVEAAIERARRDIAARVVLGVFAYMHEQIGELLTELGTRRPDVEVVVRQLNFTNQLSDLREKRIDAAVLTWPPSDTALEVQLMSSHALWVLMSDRHPLARRASVRFADIAHEPWPGPHPAVPREWVEHLFMTARRGGMPPVTPETPLTPDETWPLVAAGRAITTIPDYLAPLASRIPGVVAVPLEDGDPFVFVIARRRERPVPGPLEALFAAAARISARDRPA